MNPNKPLDVEALKKGFRPIIFIFIVIAFGNEILNFILGQIINFNSRTMIYGLVAVVLFIILISIRQINQYQRGVKFTLGKYTSMMQPGWRLVIPIFQSYQKVDMRVKAVDVPNQEAITKDNISVTVNAVIYYKIADASKAILEVEDYYYAVSQLAQTTMRNVVGEVDLDELLSKRDAIAEKIRLIVDEATDAWGVKVNSVELKDVTLPEEMKRVIGKQAEAERERRAVIIKAEGEVVAAENISKAAGVLSTHPGALHLRTLHSINDISSDQSNTVVFAVPLEILRAFEKMGK
jgi:regulator of protease activity HflC (stomatin/prohibitin superfamily)